MRFETNEEAQLYAGYLCLMALVDSNTMIKLEVFGSDERANYCFYGGALNPLDGEISKKERLCADEA